MKVSDKKYFVILVDLIRSQKLQNRQSATKRLKQSIAIVNKLFQKDIVSPMEITRGDEAALVLTSIESLMDLVFVFLDHLMPYKARIVITYGVLTTGITNRRSTEIDGPAFYLADREMIQCKRSMRKFSINTDTKVYDEAITSIMNLILLRWEKLTALRRRVFQLYDHGKTQNEIARLLKKPQQQVSQIIRSIPYDSMRDGKIAIKTLVDELHRHLQVLKNKRT
ncbi:MAG: SatD family protein [Bacteroidota bacterium]|nr:SatD family protein [Bacteroidota bacterium]